MLSCLLQADGPTVKMTAANLAVCLLIVLTGCSTGSLRDRIAAGHTAQFCHPDACFNPHILATEAGYLVTTFDGNKPIHDRVAINELRRYLLRLPLTAWPRGPEILISPSDDVYDGLAVQRNLQLANSICAEVGLAVQIRPGG